MPRLHIDLHGPTTYLTNPWAFGVNVSSAAALLRKDVQRHLLLGRDELGFRHVRFAGVFDDAMRVLSPDGAYDFTLVEQGLDWLMEQGMSPFVALSGVPAGIASTGGSPVPADVGKWVDMARALAAFVDGRYGCDAQEWHFEVWPGADDPTRWPDGPAAYYRLYDLTARAIKSVNSQLKVGGPSAADPDWAAAFVDHLAEPSETFGLDMQRCDFVTVGGTTDGPADVKSVADRLAAVRTKVTASLGESTAVILSSWGVGGRGAAPSPEADRCAAGSLAVGMAATFTDLAGGALYEAMSDADQPAAFAAEPPAVPEVPAVADGSAADATITAPSTAVRFEPFHGGRGLVTVNDVRKASFNALKLLNEHVGYRTEWRWEEPTDGLTALVSKDYHNLVRVLASYTRPAGATTAGPARFTIEGLPESVRYGQVQVLRPSAGSALEAWAEMGKPPFVNRYLLDDLEAASHPATTEVNFQEFPPRLGTCPYRTCSSTVCTGQHGNACFGVRSLNDGTAASTMTY